MAVTYDGRRSLWKATVRRVNEKEIFLGRFKTREEAVEAYEEARKNVPLKSRNYDSYVVPTEQLAAIIVEWKEKHEKEHPPRNRGAKGDDKHIVPFGAVAYIAQESGIPGRRVTAILRHETPYTHLRIADAICAGIDQPHALHQRCDILPWPINDKLDKTA